MIKLKIEKYKDFTEEENNAREENRRRNNNCGLNNYSTVTPAGVEKYPEQILETQITDEQFNAIRKAVLEQF